HRRRSGPSRLYIFTNQRLYKPAYLLAVTGYSPFAAPWRTGGTKVTQSSSCGSVLDYFVVVQLQRIDNQAAVPATSLPTGNHVVQAVSDIPQGTDQKIDRFSPVTI